MPPPARLSGASQTFDLSTFIRQRPSCGPAPVPAPRRGLHLPEIRWPIACRPIAYSALASWRVDFSVQRSGDMIVRTLVAELRAENDRLRDAVARKLGQTRAGIGDDQS